MSLTHINLDEHRVVELWPGRKLFLSSPDAEVKIVNLPKGSVRYEPGAVSDHLYFGAPGKTTVIVRGSAKKGRVSAMMDTIIAAEAPKERTKL